MLFLNYFTINAIAPAICQNFSNKLWLMLGSNSIHVGTHDLMTFDPMDWVFMIYFGNVTQARSQDLEKGGLF